MPGTTPFSRGRLRPGGPGSAERTGCERCVHVLGEACLVELAQAQLGSVVALPRASAPALPASASGPASLPSRHPGQSSRAPETETKCLCDLGGSTDP